MERTTLLFLLPLCLALSACPYRSDFPISAPKEKPDPLWAGTWNNGREMYRVRPDSSNRLEIDEDNGFQKRAVAIAWVSRVQSTAYLNVRRSNPLEVVTDTGYYVYRIDSLTANRIVLSGVSKFAIRFAPDTASLVRQLSRLAPIDFPERERVVFTRRTDKKR